jgi:hypothetical protein
MEVIFENNSIPVLSIFGFSRTGKDAVASAIQKEYPGLIRPSTSQMLTRLKQEQDRFFGIPNPPQTYDRQELYEFGCMLQDMDPAIVAKTIIEDAQLKYDAGKITGLLMVGSRRIAELRYVKNEANGVALGLISPLRRRFIREVFNNQGRQPTKWEDFIAQDQREAKEMWQMYQEADLVIRNGGNLSFEQLAERSLAFVRSTKIFD